MKRTYPLIIEQGEEALFGCFPDLPGLAVGGATREEVLQYAREFLREYLADYEARGAEPPQPSPAVALAHVEVDDDAPVDPARAKAR